MDFKILPVRSVILVLFFGLLLFGLLFWRFSSEADSPVSGNNAVQDDLQGQAPMVQDGSKLDSVTSNEEDVAIQDQLDHDRLQQEQTKDLKVKLEQTNLELEQEKAFAQLNELKKENTGVLSETVAGVHNDLPEIKVEYIGGDRIKKEAILSIGGTSYQVKDRSNPVGGIQVVSISDSSVTLHFSAPQNLTKTIDYKPE